MALAKATLAPNFSLPLLEGKQLTLSQQLPYAPILLFFYKTSCPVCQLASPYMERISQAGGTVFGICQDLDREKANRYVNEYKMTFPNALEQPGYDVSNRYDIDAVPTAFVVGSNGTITHTIESFDKAGYETAATILGVPSPFHVTDNVPVYRPG